MIDNSFTVKFILSELYNKLCKCFEETDENAGALNPSFHKEGCLYALAVKKEENIKWKKEEPTPES